MSIEKVMFYHFEIIIISVGGNNNIIIGFNECKYSIKTILKKGKIREERLNRESDWKIEKIEIDFC